MLAQLRRHIDEFASSLEPAQQATLAHLLRRAGNDDALPALAAMPAEEILDPRELALLRELEAEPLPTESALHPQVHLIVKVTRVV